MAERIVQYRKTTQLRNAEDLLGVFGIGQRTVDLLRWVVAEEAIE
jgi:DNA uptake protein ComE-like DNA-binding protein